jgi:hypothetical protein
VQALLAKEIKIPRGFNMRFSSFKALGIAAVLSLAVVFGASASVSRSTVARQAPVTADVLAYFNAHGADATLVDMVQSELKTYAGLFQGPDYIVLGQDVYSYSNSPADPNAFTVQVLPQK